MVRPGGLRARGATWAGGHSRWGTGAASALLLELALPFSAARPRPGEDELDTGGDDLDESYSGISSLSGDALFEVVVVPR